MKTLLFERVHDLLILVHSAANPSEEEWNVYVRFVQETQLSSSPVAALLVYTRGGAPNAGQRKAVLSAADSTHCLTGVCTDSAIARGVLTAMSWLNKQPMYAFKLEEVDLALQMLEVPFEHRAAAKAVLTRLHAQLERRS